MRRRQLLAEGDKYVAELIAEVGKTKRSATPCRNRRREEARCTAAAQGRVAPLLILDSGGVSHLAERSPRALALILALREEGLWPPRVPSVVLVECLEGHAGRDAPQNRFLKACDVTAALPETLARRAALLKTRARRGSAVDALVVAHANQEERS